MSKRERRAYIRNRAYTMAKTRNYRNFLIIEMHLRAKGYAEARQVLDDKLIRRELNALCEGRDPYA